MAKTQYTGKQLTKGQIVYDIDDNIHATKFRVFRVGNSELLLKPLKNNMYPVNDEGYCSFDVNSVGKWHSNRKRPAKNKADTKTVHTSGPWRQVSGPNMRSQNRDITSKKGDVALVYGSRNTDHITQKEGIANAKLIAAAPELLHALQDLVNAYELQMGKKALKLRVEIAKDKIEKATK